MFLLEKLNPYERAVFILKEVFSFSHDEVAELLDISSVNSRQILRRAKDKVRSPVKKHESDIKEQQELLEAFLLAVYQKNFDKLKDILLKDIVMYQDGGGKMAAASSQLPALKKSPNSWMLSWTWNRKWNLVQTPFIKRTRRHPDPQEQCP